MGIVLYFGVKIRRGNGRIQDARLVGTMLELYHASARTREERNHTQAHTVRMKQNTWWGCTLYLPCSVLFICSFYRAYR